MKRISFIFLFTLLLGHLAARSSQDFIIEGYGDLYVLYNEDNTVRVVSAQADGKILDTTFTKL